MNTHTLPIRTIFFGTSEVAIPSLEAIAADNTFEIVAVVTQPDRPVGRKQELQATAVKLAAERLRLPILQFERVKSEEAVQALRTLTPSLGVVVSFGQLISQSVLDLFPLGVINVHPSLLPKYRGASPMAGAIIAGETMTGVSIMRMDALMDHGPVYSQIEAPIYPDDTTPTLSDRLSHIGATQLLQTLHNLVANPNLSAQEQDHSRATLVNRYTKEDGLLDWQKPAPVLERLVRAHEPWPGTYTFFQGKRLKILKSAVGTSVQHAIGKTLIQNHSPAIACGENTSLILLRVQPEGGNIMDGATFLRGRPQWGQDSVTSSP